jgi:tetratricopeptide (TPR) repeat protein
VATESAAVDAIVTACARLPLALSVASARVAGLRRRDSLTALARELANAVGTLDALDGGDPASSVQAVLSWSYRALSPRAARLFRLLAVHPGPDVSIPAAASLVGLPVAEVGPMLTELTRAQLFTEAVPGRFSCHDLMRAFARERAEEVDPPAQRHAAVARLLDHYLHTAHAATLLLYPQWETAPVAPPVSGVSTARLATADEAAGWLHAERRGLLAAVEQAERAGFDAHTWQLAATLALFLGRQGHWSDVVATHDLALAAVARLGDQTAEARLHRRLGRAYAWLGRLADSRRHLGHALDLHRALGDPVGQAHTHLNLAEIAEQQGRHRDALEHSGQAMELYQAAGHRHGQARALNSVGWYHSLLGEHSEALRHCQAALALHSESGDPASEAATWDSLGHAHHHLGDHSQAADCYGHALGLIRQAGNRQGEARVLIHLGETQRAAGDPEAARAAWLRALAIFEEMQHADAADVRTRLDALDTV